MHLNSILLHQNNFSVIFGYLEVLQTLYELKHSFNYIDTNMFIQDKSNWKNLH